MNRKAAFACVLSACGVLGASRIAAAQECQVQQNIATACGGLGCLPNDPTHTEQGAPGHCGPCTPGIDGDGVEQCGGSACRPNGTCSNGPREIAPRPLRPVFHLVVIDASTTLADAPGYSGKPIVGGGYLFQAAFTKTEPKEQPDGTWRTPAPRVYLDLGASLAFAGNAQNVFVNAGVSLYTPSWPLAIVNVSVDALFQRTGESIWAPAKTSENVDRLGPQLSVGFLYNLYVRGAYVFALDHDSPQDHGAVVLSLVYMRDLLGDLVPDRFKSRIPANLRE